MSDRQTRPELRRYIGVGLPCLALLGSVACAHEPATPPAAPSAASAGPGTAEPGSATEAPSAASASVFVVHTVSDVEGFKQYFEANAAQRSAAGVVGYLMTRLDDGRFVVHFVAKDVATVEQTLKSDGMQQHLNHAGVPDASLVWVTRDELLKIPPTPPTGKTYSLFLKLHVSDFGALKQGFTDLDARFSREGVVAEGLHRTAARDDIAIVHLVGTDREKLDALAKSPDFVALLTKAGDRDLAKPLIGEDVARSR